MNKIKLDVKILNTMKNACSTQKKWSAINGILIQDFKRKDNEYYRYYVATNGSLMLVYRDTIKEEEYQQKSIIINCSNLKLLPKWKKVENLYLEFEVYKDKYLIFENLQLQIIEGDFPNWQRVIPDNIKSENKSQTINPTNLILIKDFFDRHNGSNYSGIYKFYNSDNNAQLIVRYANIGDRERLKLAVVMPMCDVVYAEELEVTEKLIKEIKEIKGV